MVRRLALGCVVGGMGCATFTGARPLEAGHHMVGLNVGGPMIDFGGPVPLPNAVLEGRSGLPRLARRPIELNYGVNLTAPVFGVLQAHVGASWQLTDQRRGLPAFTVTDRLWLATNAIGLGLRHEPKLQAWANDQVEIDASWLVGGQLLYLGLAHYLDFNRPNVNVTPAVGAVFDFGARGSGVLLQAEVRWFAINGAPTFDTIPWLPATAPGSIGISCGVGYAFGGGSRED